MIKKWFRDRLYNFFRDNTNTSLSFSIKLDSGKPGKNVIVLGAVHGNEKVGVRLGRQLVLRHRKGRLHLKSGSVTFILGNPEAFKRQVRYIDKDLNRNFVATKDLDDANVYEHGRVREIRKFLRENKPDVLVDLHSVSVGNFKMLIAGQDDAQGIAMLKKHAVLDILFLFRDVDVPNNTMTEVRRVGGVGVAVECGNHNKLSAIHTADTVVQLILADIGIIDIPRRLKQRKIVSPKVYKTIGIIKAGSKFAYKVRAPHTGTRLKKGEAIAYTKEHCTQHASRDCILFMPSKHPKLGDYDAGFLCVEE